LPALFVAGTVLIARFIKRRAAARAAAGMRGRRVAKARQLQ
jgi:hypothetical protein